MKNKKKISELRNHKLPNVSQLKLIGGNNSNMGIGTGGINQNPVLAAQQLGG
ncbi:hypothetical protein [uncultured Dokdonia sp.]|uniref:hypothetical protein n=1 Tax=uncultured Dokdonia sp. TaxID=575653 RepID=UPI002610326D|nr:hypothetical protein [uncultured Dokdonia sp.]